MSQYHKELRDEYLFESKIPQPFDLKKTLKESEEKIEKIGSTFGGIGSLMVALPAAPILTFLANLFFLIGDVFLITLFKLEEKRKKHVIRQYYVFTAVSTLGVIINFPGGMGI